VRFQATTAIIDLHGEMNATGEAALSAAYADVDTRGARAIVLNFENVEYINSMGIALIVSLLKQALRAQRPVSACGMVDHYIELLEITGLSDFISIFPGEADALAAASHLS
jgi:anti-anti-sigma factor